MDRARLVSNTLRLTLIVEGGTTLCHALPLHDPLLPLPQLQRLLRWHLEALELPGPVEETTIELADLLPMEGRQLDLFTRCQEGDVRRLLDELGARWGSNSVKQPRTVQSRRVEAAFAWDKPAPPGRGNTAAAPLQRTSLRPRPLLRLLPEPRPIKVALCDGRPATIKLRHKQERVVATGGPWRLCEGWWDGPLERDEYQLCTATGVYYVAHDRIGDAWSLLGAFD